MRKQIMLCLCICALLVLSACAMGKTEESTGGFSSSEYSVESSSTSDLQEENNSVGSEEEQILRIYYDLSLSNAYVPEGTEVFYDEEKGLYYTETAFGETYTLLQPRCEEYEFLCWKVANDIDNTFSDGVYALETDIYLIATWTGKVIDSPFA